MSDQKIFQVKKITGKGRGKKLGIPTINFEIPKGLSLPYGVYAGWLVIENKKYKAAIHFGPVPQFDQKNHTLEAYMLEGTIDNIPDQIQLEFVIFIREIKKFPTTADMLDQIDKDIKQVTLSLAI